MIGSAAAVQFARCNSRDTDARAFGAPDRTISIPHMRRSAGEGLAVGNNSCSKKQEAHYRAISLGSSGCIGADALDATSPVGPAAK